MQSIAIARACICCYLVQWVLFYLLILDVHFANSIWQLHCVLSIWVTTDSAGRANFFR